MITIKKDIDNRWCNSCGNKDDNYKITVGIDECKSSIFVCDDCLNSLVNQIKNLKKQVNL